jgi:hypothetical protein
MSPKMKNFRGIKKKNILSRINDYKRPLRIYDFLPLGERLNSQMKIDEWVGPVCVCA